KQRRQEEAKRAKKEQKRAVRRGEAAESLPKTEPTEAQILHRMELRRRHLGDIRSGVDEKTDFRGQFSAFKRHATGNITRDNVENATSPLAPHHSAARAGGKRNGGVEYVQGRWQPLPVHSGSVPTAAVLLRRLRRRFVFAGLTVGNDWLTIPNLVTLIRFLLVPVFVWLMFRDDYGNALIILVVLFSTDWIDGFLARKLKQGSTVGKWLDPLADRLSLWV